MAKEAFNFTDEQLWGPSQFRNAPDKRYPRHHNWIYVSRDMRGPSDGEQLYNCACCGQIARRVLAWSDERDESWRIDDSNCEPCFLTPRFALQKLGTEFGRACYPNVWVNKAMQIASSLLYGRLDDNPGAGAVYSPQEGLRWVIMPERPNGVAIPDVRFRNEIEGIRSRGGKVVRVVRPGAGLTGAAGLHQSETEQADIGNEEFDGVIVNDGSLEDLREKVAMLYKALSV